MIKIAICDDEKYMVDDISLRVMDYFDDDKEKFELFKFDNGSDFLSFYTEEGTADIVFMDIEIGNDNGIKIISEVRNVDESVIVIFVTSHTAYVQKAFSVSAFQYINKPITEKIINHELNRAISKINIVNKDFVFSTKNGFESLRINDIYYIELFATRTILHTKTEKFDFTKRVSLKKILEQLDCDSFLRCHQGGVVNISKVEIIGHDNIALKNKENIALTKKYKKEFLEQFSKYKWRNEL